MATMALSCGQMEPLWYDIGVYRLSEAATVRIPQPEKLSLASRVAAVRSARSREAIPVKRQWPAFDVRTRHWRFSPSRAMAYVDSSSHQKAFSKRCRST